ncbi:hypothetical protein Vretimale_4356 [Volvox reticuliferus]|uniref:Uncharacterized protein n=1 Tax=Volvox reticuliferus TaxID=1737510 RepID=A0A8J4DDT4_9CHLO|nr:hypothetical protein Vretimale_4356 [Volvox reticuliferus]
MRVRTFIQLTSRPLTSNIPPSPTQVMFDQTGHPDLSDFVRVMVFNTSDPAAKEVVGDLRALRAASSANRRGGRWAGPRETNGERKHRTYSHIALIHPSPSLFTNAQSHIHCVPGQIVCILVPNLHSFSTLSFPSEPLSLTPRAFCQPCVARSTPGSGRRRPPTVPPPPPRFLVHVPDDPSTLRFAALLSEGHRLVAGAQAAAERRRQQEEEERRAMEAREARARARFAAAAGAGRRGIGAKLERRLSDASARQRALGRDKPELLPYWLADVEEQWRRTVATRVPAEGVYDSVIMAHESLPVYEAMPEAALLRIEAEEAAAAPPSRYGLGMGSVGSRAAQSYSSLFNAFGGARPNGGSGTQWSVGGLGASTSTAGGAGKHLASSGRPGSGRGPQLSGDYSSAMVGPEFSASSRFPPGAVAKRGNRAVVLAPGPEGGPGEGSHGGDVSGSGVGVSVESSRAPRGAGISGGGAGGTGGGASSGGGAGGGGGGHSAAGSRGAPATPL